jgi:hypothetical protein
MVIGNTVGPIKSPHQPSKPMDIRAPLNFDPQALNLQNAPMAVAFS